MIAYYYLPIMIIKNFNKLATSSLRKQLLTIAEAGYEAIDTKEAVKKSLVYDVKSQILKVGKEKFDLKKFNRVVLVGFGKATIAAMQALYEILGERVNVGMGVDLSEAQIGSIQIFAGTHPKPSEQNISHVKKITELVGSLTEKDLVICAISGGGSSLFCYPYDLTAEEQGKLFDALTKKGADIFELNIVRKHVSRVKGGNLAKLIYPATCVSLIFSDVPGDDLSIIASGPTVKDPSVMDDAKKILDKYDIVKDSGLRSIKLYETPKEDKYFKNIHNTIIVSAKLALSAMREKAGELGYDVKIYNDRFQGEARILGPKIIEASKKGQCLLGAGESTVKILGQGKGGRNQEMALAALLKIREGQVFGSFASDGHDNTDAAGAIVDLSTLERAHNLQLATGNYLNNNDSFTFFDRIGDMVLTGLTGSNVADFFILLEK